MSLVDFASDPDGAARRIDAWVGQQTHDLIPQLIKPGVLGADTRLVLVDALYLKAAWPTPFGGPEPGAFHLADGSTVRVPMMLRGKGMGPHRQPDRHAVVRLPYLSRDLAMTVIVPDPGRFAAVSSAVAAHGVRPFLGGVARAYEVTMPSFRVDTSADMTALLRTRAPLPFSDAADLSGITRQESLQIAEVLHQAVVQVDRNGTVAAAATAVGTTSSSAEITVPLTVDRPFLFVIHETAHDTPLFVGRVVDPRS